MMRCHLPRLPLLHKPSVLRLILVVEQSELFSYECRSVHTILLTTKFDLQLMNLYQKFRGAANEPTQHHPITRLMSLCV